MRARSASTGICLSWLCDVNLPRFLEGVPWVELAERVRREAREIVLQQRCCRGSARPIGSGGGHSLGRDLAAQPRDEQLDDLSVRRRRFGRWSRALVAAVARCAWVPISKPRSAEYVRTSF
jgi:hypothetical protein